MEEKPAVVQTAGFSSAQRGDAEGGIIEKAYRDIDLSDDKKNKFNKLAVLQSNQSPELLAKVELVDKSNQKGKNIRGVQFTNDILAADYGV